MSLFAIVAVAAPGKCSRCSRRSRTTVAARDDVHTLIQKAYCRQVTSLACTRDVPEKEHAFRYRRLAGVDVRDDADVAKQRRRRRRRHCSRERATGGGCEEGAASRVCVVESDVVEGDGVSQRRFAASCQRGVECSRQHWTGLRVNVVECK